MHPWSIYAFDTSVDPARFAADLAAWGISRAVLGPEFLTDDRFAAALRAHGRELWLNLPVFYAPWHLPSHPEQYAITWGGQPAIHQWLHMGCPCCEELLDARRTLFASLLDRLRPAVLSLDFIRFHVYWEGVAMDGDPAAVVDGCYCPRCLAAFARFTGEPAMRDEAGRIVRQQWPAWARWKTERITAVAAELVQLLRKKAPGVPILAKTIPWGPELLADGLHRIAGQDVEALARLTDGALPMALLHLLKRDLAWRRQVLDDVERRTGKPVASYVQLDSITGGTIPLPDVRRELEACLAERRAPLLFHYNLLAQDPARAALVRELAAPR